jgi:hypothetical protein
MRSVLGGGAGGTIGESSARLRRSRAENSHRISLPIEDLEAPPPPFRIARRWDGASRRHRPHAHSPLLGISPVGTISGASCSFSVCWSTKTHSSGRTAYGAGPHSCGFGPRQRIGREKPEKGEEPPTAADAFAPTPPPLRPPPTDEFP